MENLAEWKEQDSWIFLLQMAVKYPYHNILVYKLNKTYKTWFLFNFTYIKEPNIYSTLLFLLHCSYSSGKQAVDIQLICDSGLSLI